MTTSGTTTMSPEQMQTELAALQRWADGAHALLVMLFDGQVRYPVTPPPPQPPRHPGPEELAKYLWENRHGTVLNVKVQVDGSVREFDVPPPRALTAGLG